jgi:peroxiredoxin
VNENNQYICRTIYDNLSCEYKLIKIFNHMRRIMFFICAALTVLSASASVKYTVNGTVPATMNGQKVYLMFLAKQSRTPQDSTVVANGKFKFAGVNDNVDIAYIFTRPKDKATKGHACMAVLGQAPVSISLVGEELVAKGGNLNQALVSFNKDMKAIKEKPAYANLNKMVQEYRDPKTTADRKKEIEDLYNKYDEENAVAVKQNIDKNLNNMIGGFIFADYGQNYLDEKETAAYIDKAGAEFKNYPMVKSMIKQIEAAKVRSVGRAYTDFEMADVNGAMHKLSEYIGNGKYVMVDFWASWCGPCRGEMPNVKAAYEKFHSKGFEIVGVSLDNKKEAWTKAIADLGITWTQLSDLQGWKNAAAQKYGVNAIPCTLLIGPDGKIVASNLRGEELSKKLGELLK